MHSLIHKHIALLAGVLLVASACAGSGSPPAASEPPAAPTAVPPTATTAPTSTPVPTHTPAPTDTPEPVAASGDACVLGTWELSDMSVYMSSIIPATSEAEFTFAGQEGYVRYTFSADGTVSFEANNFVVRFAIGVSGVSLDLAVSIDGSGTAVYSADAGAITISNSDTDSLTFSATLGGEEMFSGTSGELGSLFGVSEDAASATLLYQCAGDTLTYTPPVDIDNVQPVVLTRVGP